MKHPKENPASTQATKAEPLAQNHLKDEKSPYLLQHVTNPVDWHPWCDQAFTLAAETDRPIFLSIGYSTCHWCHVMAHESFEDPQVAAVLNRHFISIKVDREERPDVDAVYMTACQLFTGQGGWPLTVVMTPDKKPFFATTYIPRHEMGGRLGMIDVLEKINGLWHSDRDKLIDSGNDLAQRLIETSEASLRQGPLTDEPLQQAIRDYQRQFDPRYGGFGQAPKFPAPHNLSLLLQLQSDEKPPPQAMALKTLKDIRQGGIYDQVGFGLHRYSVDQHWLVPHFEKMLYDQAMITLALTDAWQVAGDPLFKRAAGETCAYVLRDLRLEGGGFACGEDADSEGEEGTFYLWDKSEIEDLLGQQASLFCHHYQVTADGNFEGRNILHLRQSPPEDHREVLEQCRQTLLAARDKRIRPHRDDKVLTGWNGLMIAALARYGAVFGDNGTIEAATEAADFIWHSLRSKEGRLMRRYRQGEVAIKGFLEDYAFYGWGLFELYLATASPVMRTRAIALHQQALEIFSDGAGGLYETGADAESVWGRGRSEYDGAYPAATSVMACTLQRLAVVDPSHPWQKAVEPLLQQNFGKANETPTSQAHYLQALHLYHRSLALCRVVVPQTMPRNDEAVKKVLQPLQSCLRPELMTIVAHQGSEEAGELTCQNGQPTAYLCLQGACQPPVTTPTALADQLALCLTAADSV